MNPEPQSGLTEAQAQARAAAMVKASALLCHLDRDDLHAFHDLLELQGVFDDPAALIEVLLGMGHLTLDVLRAALGADGATHSLRDTVDQLLGVAAPPDQHDQ